MVVFVVVLLCVLLGTLFRWLFDKWMSPSLRNPFEYKSFVCMQNHTGTHKHTHTRARIKWFKLIFITFKKTELEGRSFTVYTKKTRNLPYFSLFNKTHFSLWTVNFLTFYYRALSLARVEKRVLDWGVRVFASAIDSTIRMENHSDVVNAIALMLKLHSIETSISKKSKIQRKRAPWKRIQLTQRIKCEK